MVESRKRRWGLGISAAALVMSFVETVLLAEGGERLRVTLRVDLGEDTGQDFGSLFEVCDASGDPVFGAGFLAAYNTYYRADRHVVHFFARTVVGEPVVSSMARPTGDSGVYLFDDAGVLFARSASGGRDGTTRVWQPEAESWRIDTSVPTSRTRVGGGVLECSSNIVRYDGEVILQVPSSEGTTSCYYYSQGRLFCLLHYPKESNRRARVYACPWKPGYKDVICYEKGTFVELATSGEFIFSYGQLDGRVILATNLGGVHRFDGRQWDTLRAADPKTSFQIYSMIHFGNRLLMGHYPTGNLYEYDGQQIRLLPDRPPAMPGVSKHAREAQTLSIYRGDLYAGVWPWGEVWRYDRGRDRWEFVRRMFTQPPVTDSMTHPYETLTGQRDPVANLWGQRVTSMIPLGDTLFISTSSKAPFPFDPKFDFLTEETRKEYGMVYRLRLPGHLSTRLEWATGPTRLEFVIGAGSMSIAQDGKQLATSRLESQQVTSASNRISWGDGIYGPLQGRFLESAVTGLER